MKRIVIISHSNLVYWWPVWAVGFLLGILSLLSGQKLATVPDGTAVAVNAHVVGQTPDGQPLDAEGREALVLPAGKTLHHPGGDPGQGAEGPRLHMVSSKGFGVLFVTVLLFVVVVTNVPLRGLWSVLIIAVLILLAVIFAQAHWWGTILSLLGHLDVRINAGGYFFLSGLLLLLWLLAFFFFDRQVYVIISPSNIRVCTEIGGGETMYTTRGSVLEKQRSDLFRHWILGLGAGDLVLRTGGATPTQLDLPNVLFAARKLHQAQRLLKELPIVEAT